MKKILTVLAVVLGTLALTGCFGQKVKGNVTNDHGRTYRTYHLPGDPSYDKTKAEVYFDSEQQARDAGFKHAGNAR